ncbi:hypothetical protein FACS189420_3920 [Bacteroidia bacterium]|nr:hypothetical protein FACS189420_3920 [Bacteroidia bacterium]
MKKTIYSQVIIITLVLFNSYMLCAQVQNVYSLVNMLETKELSGEEKLALYKTIMESTGNSRILVKCINDGLPLAQQENNKSKESMFIEYTARLYVGRAMFDSVFFYLDKALELAVKSKDDSQIESVYTSYAVALGNQGKLDKMIEYQLKALEICEKNNNKQGIIAALSNIGSAYGMLKDNEHAIVYSKRALAMAEELNLTNHIATINYSLGSHCFNLKDFENAEKYLLKAHEMIQSVHGSEGMKSYILIALCTLYGEGIIDLEKAEKYGKRGLDIVTQLHNPQMAANAYMGMSNIYRIQERYVECDIAATKAWELDTINMDMGLEITANLTVANIKLGNNKKALQFFEKYYDLVDKYTEQSMHDSFTGQQVKYETEKKELRIAALEKEHTLYIWLGIVDGTLLLSLLLLFMLRNKVKRQRINQLEQEKQIIATQSVLDGETAERTRLARDLHDGLGGMLSVVKLNLADVEHLQNAREMLDQSINELRRVAHHMMPESLLRYGLKVSLEDFCLSVPNAKFHYFGDDSRLENRTEILLYRCAHELVNNAIKYSNAETINIQLVQSADRVSLTVQDNGCGFDPETVAGQGMGLENLRTRVAACNGVINVYSSPGKGTEVYVEIRFLFVIK